MKAVVLSGVLIALAACSEAQTDPPACRALTFDGAPYSICRFDPLTADLRLLHTAPDGNVYGQFDRLAEALAEDGQTLSFAMNAGMYHDDRAPVGYYLENDEQIAPLQIGESPGNFGLVPNGVFAFNDQWAGVIETQAFQDTDWIVPPTHATQSGPMLVIDGELHPKFNADGPSKKRRNGVGVDADGIVHFAISDVPVNFHSFARLFRDELATPNALFLDGTISKLYAPELDRNDTGLDMGPIVAVIDTKDPQ
jgi:uncharacterized protein YigE (DUF2233 family)